MEQSVSGMTTNRSARRIIKRPEAVPYARQSQLCGALSIFLAEAIESLIAVTLHEFKNISLVVICGFDEAHSFAH